MIQTLPFELQLRILELAVPPLIYRTLDERTALKALSLAERNARAKERLEAKQAQGFPLKRIAVTLAAPVDLETTVIGTAFELWARVRRGNLGLISAVGLRRLHIETGNPLPTLRSHQITSQLRYIALHYVALAANWDFRHFAALEALVLESVLWKQSSEWLTQLRHLPMRVLCCKIPLMHFSLALLAGNVTLQHFALVEYYWKHIEQLRDDLQSLLVLPPRLETFTFCATYSMASAAVPQLLEQVCSQNGTSRFVRQDLTAAHVEAWDAEEWAYSVGA